MKIRERLMLVSLMGIFCAVYFIGPLLTIITYNNINV